MMSLRWPQTHAGVVGTTNLFHVAEVVRVRRVRRECLVLVPVSCGVQSVIGAAEVVARNHPPAVVT